MSRIYLTEVAKLITPEQVRFICEKSAGGLSQRYLHEEANEFFNVDYISDQASRKILHRTYPFDVPDLYRMVPADVAKAVHARFHAVGRKRRTYAQKSTVPSPVTDLSNADQTAQILVKALRARAEWEAALSEACEIGLSSEAVKAWVTMATGGDLK